MRVIIGIICVMMIVLTGCQSSRNKGVEDKVMNDRFEITTISLDKSTYQPGEKVVMSIGIKNKTEKTIKDITLDIKVDHIDETIETINEKGITIAPSEELIKTIEYTPNATDFQGYLATAILWDNKSYSTKSVGFDVASDWRKFPRYGYVCRYEEDVKVQDVIDPMVDYHINVIEYYDWHYLHHQPLADDITREEPGRWQDWSGRWIEGQVVADYIQLAKEKNMINMAYNMIYAGTDTFFVDKDKNPTEPEKWKLHFAKENSGGTGEFKFTMGFSPSGNGNLYFVNPLNKDWQKHIFNEENKIFQVFDFDGWHGDTVGDWGKMVTYDGEPLGVNEKGEPIYSVKKTYTTFLNRAKATLGDKYLTFNPVGAQGIEQVNVSNVDALYAEFWPWDKDIHGKSYDTYHSLVEEIERSMEESKDKSFDKKGKSLTVKAYINYDKTHGFMNEPGVLLADAAVYMAGGSRLELGDGDRLLHVEYYPDNDILMSDDLKIKMKLMSDFIVAYENVLRDGQETTDNRVLIEEVEVSRRGMSNKVWAYTRKDATREILHLVNLLGTDNKWRDERGKKTKPTVLSEFKVTYYTDLDVKKVALASPDFTTGECHQLKFEKGVDEQGKYISFTVPSLEYWDMIILQD